MSYNFNFLVGICLCLSIYLLLNPIKANANASVEQSHSTSVVGMVKLLLLEARLVKELKSYKNEVERKLTILKSAVPQLRAESANAMSQMEDYVSNPLNAFSLVRRMHKDWIDWKVFIEEPIGWSHVDYFAQQQSQLPSPTDLEEVCEAIQRLKEIYSLTIGDMAKGYLNGKQYDSSLNALDTFAMGKFLYTHNYQYLAMEWFVETIKWLLSNQTLPNQMEDEPEKMLQFIAKAFVEQKFYSNDLPKLEHGLAIGNKTYDIPELKLMANLKDSAKRGPNPDPMLTKTIASYSVGCSGKFVPQTKLYCEYKFRTSPFLLLAPIKMEILLENPRIVVFHNILSDREINELQNLARPLLSRSSVLQDVLSLDKVRTAKGVWLEQDLNNLTKRIVRRTAHMTELILQEAEELQIMNYGVAGHYLAHYDCFNTTEKRESQMGDRIATVLFYLSDVEQGGGTVFPKLKVAVSPERGMALFWYNLLDDGTADDRSLHGGCPVLVGSKWVMTQWIRERNQIFTRPCLKRLTN